MGPTERLAETAETIAREYESNAGRPMTPAQLVDLAILLDKTFITFANASIPGACAMAWQALQEPAQ